ncbi:hypothetical protein GCM10027515_09290 [Schumannella luteola]|uniref:Putative membrane protein YgcG n=1 Tax=Schumannella luteola TaxID=472059 RepID=A0A852YCR7_9MICO|nr:putative membrane protein YgcG [Schumannella luteola]TPX01631.1 DUF2207 domain-containing protein [Schumannella luteola]
MKRRILSLLVAVAAFAGAGLVLPGGAPASASPASAAAPAAVAPAAAPATLAPAAAARAALPAGVADFTFESMTADYTVTRDEDGQAQMKAVETFVALFPDYDQNRGIIRALPLRDTRFSIPLSPRVESVTTATGDQVPFETDTNDGFLEIAVGDDSYVHGRTTYVITYTMKNVINQATSSVQEFSPNVNGTGWDQSFGTVTANLHLDSALEAQLTGDAACYIGAQGSTDRCSATRTDDGFTASGGPIAARQNITLSVGFRDGTFTVPASPNDSPLATLVPWFVLGLGVIGLVAVIVVRTTRWKDAPGRGIVIAEYEAPEGLGILPAAAFAERSWTGLPALLVQTAVSGATRLVDQPEESESRRYRVDVVKPEAITNQDDWWAMTALLGQAPTAGHSFVLDRDDQRIGDRITGLGSGARSRLAEFGLRKRVTGGGAGRLVRIIAIVVIVAAVLLLGWAGVNAVRAPAVFLGAIGGGLLAIVTLFLSVPPVRRTREGSLLNEKLEGLKLYLTVAEEERLKVLQSVTGAERRRVDPNDPAQVVRLYEELLPWAMILGVEGSWAKVLGDRYATTPPQSGDGLVSPGVLWNLSAFQIANNTSQFATTPPEPSTSWSSSGGGGGFSSGSSGGGFSGGGFGGGGGGGR